MKDLFLKAVIPAFLILPELSFSQHVETTYSAATITEDYCVTLDPTEEISEFYEIDIHDFGFETEIEATKKFGFISNNLLTYSVDFENEKAYLQVHLDRTPEPRDIIWWNEYLNSLCGL